jgi:hypothetical protein
LVALSDDAPAIIYIVDVEVCVAEPGDCFLR